MITSREIVKAACIVSFQQLSLRVECRSRTERGRGLCPIYPLCYLEWLMVHSLPNRCSCVPYINYTLRTN